VPAGATIVTALMYWQTVEKSQSALAGQRGYFNGYPIVGKALGNPNAPVAWSGGGCAGSSQGATTLRTYRADVRPYLNPGANGTYPVRLADSGSNGGGAPLTLGASLVIIYRATRVLNFATGQMLLLSALVFATLTVTLGLPPLRFAFHGPPQRDHRTSRIDIHVLQSSRTGIACEPGFHFREQRRIAQFCGCLIATRLDGVLYIAIQLSNFFPRLPAHLLDLLPRFGLSVVHLFPLRTVAPAPNESKHGKE